MIVKSGENEDEYGIINACENCNNEIFTVLWNEEGDSYLRCTDCEAVEETDCHIDKPLLISDGWYGWNCRRLWRW